MGTGIIVCGLNGSGKSTLAKALAKSLGFHFIDIEDLCFPKTDPKYTYASPRAKDEVKRLLLSEINAHENFVVAAVKNSHGEAVLPYYSLAVLVEASRDIRLKRVYERSFQKFGCRMMPGGDLYEQERAFFDLVSSRSEDYVQNCLTAFDHPVIRVDGTRPVAENIRFITDRISDYIKHS